MTIDVRKHDEERVMEAFKRAKLDYSEGMHALGMVTELADLVDEVRHETIAKCRDEVTHSLNLVSNGAMTSRRLRKLLAAENGSKAEGT